MYKKWYFSLIFIAVSQVSLNATSAFATIGAGLRASGRAVATVFRKGRVAIPLTVAALLVSDRIQVLYYHARQATLTDQVNFAQQQLAVQKKRYAEAQQALVGVADDVVVLKRHNLEFEQANLSRLETSPNSPGRLAVKKHYYDAALARGSYAYRFGRFTVAKTRETIVAVREYNRQRVLRAAALEAEELERAREARRAARRARGR